MYGLIIEGVRYMIEDHLGSDTWTLVVEKLQLKNATFSTHERYSERIIPDMLQALMDITGQEAGELGIMLGRYFIKYMIRMGYGDLLKVQGRRFNDFLKGLDALHVYFRFSYPKIRAPSFYCDKETAEGLTLHYRSRRKGYISYVQGLLLEIAEDIFQETINIELTKREDKGSFQFTLLRITFNNQGFQEDQALRQRNSSLNEYLTLDTVTFLNIFPYFIAFNKKMAIVVVGEALRQILPDVKAKMIDEQFELALPLVKFTWDACLHHLNNLFELKTSYRVQKKLSHASIQFVVNDRIEDKVKVKAGVHDDHLPGQVEQNQDDGHPVEEDDDDGAGGGIHGAFLHLRGPMIYLKHSEIIVYLPSVMIESLDNLFDVGLYLNDYSVSDCNREIIMASVQKSDDLKELLKKEKEKSKTLSKNMREIDESRKKAKELLRTMMPLEVANELLLSGKKTVTISEAFEAVTLSFAKITHFNEMTNQLPPMEVVNFLNTIYSLFDEVTQKHGVYKVETVGEAYMISCGVPYETPFHAEYVADTTMDMIEAMRSVGETLVPGRVVEVKIGVHTGPCVGGVVGLRAPRYCLFGDTVNVASRLESHNKVPMTVQVSVKTKVTLESNAPGQFSFESRGKVNLKGKGEMLAFAITGKKGPPRYLENPLITAEREDDERSAIYTPMEDLSEHTRASSMSRMSISISGSRTPTRSGSRGSHGSNSPKLKRHSSEENTDNVTPIPMDEEEVQKKHEPAKKTKEEPKKKATEAPKKVAKMPESHGQLGVAASQNVDAFEKPPTKEQPQMNGEVSNGKETKKPKEKEKEKESKRTAFGVKKVVPEEQVVQNGISSLPKVDSNSSLPKVEKTKPSSKQVKEEAKSVVQNHAQETVKPLDKNPLPPIDNSSKMVIAEEEIVEILKVKDEKINGLTTTATNDESIQRECICGSFVDRQKVKTKVCLLM